MKHPFLCDLDYSRSFLSSFDISGILLLQDNNWQSKGIEDDYKQLMNDHDVLEKDYRNAVEKVLKDNVNDHI